MVFYVMIVDIVFIYYKKIILKFDIVNHDFIIYKIKFILKFDKIYF